MIVQNEIKCLTCGDEIHSTYRHDFRFCSCHSVGVDGGLDYLRRVGENPDSYMDLSLQIDDTILEVLLLCLVEMKETNRNEFGTICGLARVLRDFGYEVREIGDE